MLKILQTRLKQYMNRELLDVQPGFQEAEEPEVKLPSSLDHGESKGVLEKLLLLLHWRVDHNTLWKILKDVGIPDRLTCPLRKLYMGQEATVRTRHGTTDWFTVGEGVRQGCCMLSPSFFNVYAVYIVQNELQAGWITSRNQSCWEKHQQPQICRWYHFNGRKWRGTKESLDEDERGEWKSWLEIQHSKYNDHGLLFHHFMAYIWEKVEAVTDFIFLVSKITLNSDCSYEIKRCLLLGRKAMTNLDSI